MKFFFDLLHSGRSKEDRDDFDEREAFVARFLEEYGAKLVSECL
jgi:hypothetical protein